jgi:hypothetical protein
MNNYFSKNPLFFVFVIPIIVDVVGTVLGQPPEYWSSGGEIFSEAVPLIYLLLKLNPLLFIVTCLLLWLPTTYWLVNKLKAPLNLWATMSLLVGHGYNSVNWLRRGLYQAGIFTGNDQLSQSLSLLPMTLYIILVGYFSSIALLHYFGQARKIK